ncbi:hypothetical protein EDB89DRAFT_1848107, partial [Lactarius sanguifluus]
MYTQPFNWVTQPDTLFEFLWRLNFLSDVKHSYDTTVTSVADDEATYRGLENVAKADLHKFLVRDDRTSNGRIEYYIPSPIWESEALFGHTTFGYDPETTNMAYLKDFWRTDHHGIQKEGDVYRELHDAQVPHIAILGLAGDIPLLPEFRERIRLMSWSVRVDPYVHYRLVLETLGSPLNTFKSTRVLCEVIRDVLTGTWALTYQGVQILHRDVSAGNILITEERSVFIDWDLSKKVLMQMKIGFRECGNSYPFIRIARLQGPSTRPHEVSDDLESFFWVLLY